VVPLWQLSRVEATLGIGVYSDPRTKTTKARTHECGVLDHGFDKRRIAPATSLPIRHRRHGFPLLPQQLSNFD
jgi:hypothetical protein